MLFQAFGMRGAVGAKEETRAIARGRLNQRLSMRFTLQNRQTIPMRSHAPLKQGVTVVQQVMGGDRRRNRPLGIAHIMSALACGDVFEHHLKLRKRLTQRDHDTINEHCLAIEQISVFVGYFPMHQQRHIPLLHGFKRRATATQQIGYSGVGIGRCTRRV